ADSPGRLRGRTSKVFLVLHHAASEAGWFRRRLVVDRRARPTDFHLRVGPAGPRTVAPDHEQPSLGFGSRAPVVVGRRPSRLAKLVDRTAIAVGIAGPADVAAVEDQAMADPDPALARAQLAQPLLDRLRLRVRLDQPEPLRDPRDVSVDHDPAGDPERDPEHQVGGLVRRARQPDQLLVAARDLAAVAIDDRLRTLADRPGLVAKVAAALDHLLDLLLRRRGQIGRRRPALEQR